MAEQIPTPLKRRAPLRLVVAGVGAAPLAACGALAGGSTTAPTSAPAADVAPTAVSVVAARTAPPQALEMFGSETAKVRLRYGTILGSVDGIVMNDLVRKFSQENPDIAIKSLQGLADFIRKMQASSISDTAPDIALVRHTSRSSSSGATTGATMGSSRPAPRSQPCWRSSSSSRRSA